MSLAVHLGLGVGLAAHARRATPPALASGSGAATPTAGPAALGGDTFQIDEAPPDELPAAPDPPAAPASEATVPPASADSADSADSAGSRAPPPIDLDEAATLPRPRPSAAHHARATKTRGPVTAASDPTAPAPPPARTMYGAVGDRSASDLVVTFKRAFPQAGSSDPIWNQVPVGFYADGDVTFFLSDAGALTRATVSPTAAPAFRAAIARTVALIKGRAFTARGAETHLHMLVRVSDQLTNHGAFTIDAAGSFELPSGRRVAVSITER